MSAKILPCTFDDSVLCSFRKHESVMFMSRCETCKHYLRFCREMQKEEDEFFDEVEKIRRGEFSPYGR